MIELIVWGKATEITFDELLQLCEDNPELQFKGKIDGKSTTFEKGSVPGTIAMCVKVN